MNESFPRLSLSLSLLALPFTFYVPKGVEKRQQRFKPKGKGVTEKTFFFFVRFEMTGLPGPRVPRKPKKEGGNERRKRGDRKAGMTSLETRSAKRDTRVANNRGAKRRGEERGGGKSVRRRKTWTRFNSVFKFFRFFLEGEGEGNNWGRKGIDPGEER